MGTGKRNVKKLSNGFVRVLVGFRRIPDYFRRSPSLRPPYLTWISSRALRLHRAAYRSTSRYPRDPDQCQIQNENQSVLFFVACEYLVFDPLLHSLIHLYIHSMLGMGRGGVRGKGRGKTSSNKEGGRRDLRASLVAPADHSHIDTRQSNGEWKSDTLREGILRLTRDARIHSITILSE